MEEYANLIAEHIVQPGGMAEGTVHAVTRRSSLDEYVLATADGQGHTDALATTLTSFDEHVCYANDQVSELKDADTADLFTAIARGIDKGVVHRDEPASRQLSREGRDVFPLA